MINQKIYILVNILNCTMKNMPQSALQKQDINIGTLVKDAGRIDVGGLGIAAGTGLTLLGVATCYGSIRPSAGGMAGFSLLLGAGFAIGGVTVISESLAYILDGIEQLKKHTGDYKTYKTLDDAF